MSNVQPEFIVMCQVSGGVTGFRQTELKSNGKIRHFENFKAADDEAKRLMEKMNSPYRTCDFKYWAVVR